jgi:hypothetical protein
VVVKFWAEALLDTRLSQKSVKSQTESCLDIGQKRLIRVMERPAADRDYPFHVSVFHRIEAPIIKAPHSTCVRENVGETVLTPLPYRHRQW